MLITARTKLTQGQSKCRKRMKGEERGSTHYTEKKKGKEYDYIIVKWIPVKLP